VNSASPFRPGSEMEDRHLREFTHTYVRVEM